MEEDMMTMIAELQGQLRQQSATNEGPAGAGSPTVPADIPPRPSLSPLREGLPHEHRTRPQPSDKG
jgi:hypothetical protein